jgi:hypothetical protein
LIEWAGAKESHVLPSKCEKDVAAEEKATWEARIRLSL